MDRKGGKASIRVPFQSHCCEKWGHHPTTKAEKSDQEVWKRTNGQESDFAAVTTGRSHEEEKRKSEVSKVEEEPRKAIS